jgi:hypothetical protein
VASCLSVGRFDGAIVTCAAHEWAFEGRGGGGVNPTGARLRRFANKVKNDVVFGNRDILIASVAAGLASVIMILVDLAQLGALFGFSSDEYSGSRIPLNSADRATWSTGRHQPVA